MFPRLTAAVLGGALALGAGGAPAQSPALQTAMREKLANTQGLLEALVRADYAAMTRFTDYLSRISETEIASWQKVPTQPEYVEQAVQFLRAVNGIRQASAGSNLEAAAREYSALVSSCIRCHASVRTAARGTRP